MNINDIFDDNGRRAYVSVNGQRFAFTVSEECKKYYFDKTLGVYLNIYFDHIDIDLIQSELEGIKDTYQTGIDYSLEIAGPQLTIKPYAFNVETNQYDLLNVNGETFFALNGKNKKSVGTELVILPAHVDDNGSIQLLIKFAIGEKVMTRYGFLGNKTREDNFSYKPSKVELKTTLVAERKRNDYVSRNDEANEQEGPNTYYLNDNFKGWNGF